LRFLTFTIEKTLGGKQDELKEYTIGAEVYDRKPSFNPMHDSIVRTEARRLRHKLKEFYDGSGENHVVSIHFSPGRYVPEFRFKLPNEAKQTPIQHSEETPRFNDGRLSIIILPFRNLSDTTLGRTLAYGITEDLLHLLAQDHFFRVLASTTLVQLGLTTSGISALLSTLGAGIAFEGSVRVDDDEIWITARIVNSDGFQLQSHKFELARDSAHLLRTQQQIASVLAGLINRSHGSAIWNQNFANHAVRCFNGAAVSKL
jgi:TolB-like protein